VVPLVGHNLVRLAVNGCGRELSATALDACVGLLDENLGQGAAGASTGLLYTPACFAGTRELVALASTVARHRGLLSCHIRDEGNRLADSIGELLEVAAASGASLQISHLKVSGRANWGRLSAVLDRIQELAAAGHDITFDSYPYLFGCSTILTLFPLELLREPLEAVIARLVEPRYRAWARTVIAAPDGLLTTVGPENIRVASSSVVGPVPLVGRTLADIAPDWGCDVPELICELVAQERGRTSIFLFQMSEGDVRRALAHPLGCIGSDGIPAPSGTAHPRLGSAFLQMLCRYVRDEPVCALPEAVRKMTALPARKLGLRGRGRIDVGQVGDVVVLDLGRLAAGDTTTGRSRRGVDWVVLDGRIVVENAAYNGVRAGRLLRR
jgi:N-acyl-D-aspartate/D-glutamate deacylase